MKNPLAHPVFVVFAVAALAFVLPGVSGGPHVERPDVLIIEHGYDGPIEQAGALTLWRYSAGMMHVEWVDTTKNGVFRNGFENQGDTQ